jgi:hypothetical protein
MADTLERQEKKAGKSRGLRPRNAAFIAIFLQLGKLIALAPPKPETPEGPVTLCCEPETSFSTI